MAKKLKQARIISLSNLKGGVGKTCSTCNIGACLNRMGKKVLLVDLDPQSNLTCSLGPEKIKNSIYHVLHGHVPISSVVHNISKNFDLIPATLDLLGAEIEFSSMPSREYILKDALSSVVSSYDYILIDCAPSLGVLTTNALTASSEVFIPLKAHPLSIQGIGQLTNVIDKVKVRLNKELEIGGVFITMYDSRNVLNRDVSELIRERFAKTIFKTKIRENITLAEAPLAKKDIFAYDPNSRGAADYEALCTEIINRHK
jgi:chromosome partitioning protein